MNIGLPSLLFLILFTLKLVGTLTISWFWVLSPLWITGICAFIFMIYIAYLSS